MGAWRFDPLKSIVMKIKGNIRMGEKPELSRARKIRLDGLGDRITFEVIFEQSGYRESDVIAAMHKRLKRSSFRNRRQRVAQQSNKH